MKREVVQNLTATFEAHAQQTEGGVEYWLARDLQYLLGYTQWRNFLNVVSRAKSACEVSGHTVTDHFADVSKMVDLGSGSQREIDDIMLSRYACYLIAQNGDPTAVTQRWLEHPSPYLTNKVYTNVDSVLRHAVEQLFSF